MGAFFTSDDDLDSNIGTPIIFILNEDINEDTSWKVLKKKKNALQYFYKTDLHHNADDDEDGV